MFRFPLLTILLLLSLLACGEPDRSKPDPAFSLHPNVDVRTHLARHIEGIFEDVDARDGDQLDLDRRRVTDIHQLAFVIELYKERAGHYPFADSVGSISNVILGDDVERDDPHYIDDETFVTELARVLGDSLTLALEPSGEASRRYVYSVYGRRYGVAAMLYHPVSGSEGIREHEWQYRVGSSEGTQFPMFEARRLFTGGYAKVQPARFRRSRAR